MLDMWNTDLRPVSSVVNGDEEDLAGGGFGDVSLVSEFVCGLKPCWFSNFEVGSPERLTLLSVG